MGSASRAALMAALSATVMAQVPSWPATYQMNRSTIAMVCNNTGYVNPLSVEGWSILDVDWSSGKGTGTADGWAKHKPMDCEEMLIKQVDMVRAPAQILPNPITLCA